MTKEEHLKRHEELHKSLDELVADWIRHTNEFLCVSTVFELMEWSHSQTLPESIIHTEVEDAVKQETDKQ